MIKLRRPSDSDIDALARIDIDSWNHGFGELIGHSAKSTWSNARYSR